MASPCADLVGIAAPDGILVLDGHEPFESPVAEPLDDPSPVDLAEAGDPVPPPAAVPRVGRSVDGPPEVAVPVARRRVDLDVLRLDVQHLVDVPRQDGDRVDPEPLEMRRIEVEVEPEPEHPVPELGRVRQVGRVAVGMPPLHRAVLDDEPHTALGGVVDQRRQSLLGQPEVVVDSQAHIAADERADQADAQQMGCVDDLPQVAVDVVATLEVAVEVVLVVRERGDLDTVGVEQTAHLLGGGLVERGDVDMAGLPLSAGNVWPDRDLEALVALGRSPTDDLVERHSRQACREEAEPHACAGTLAYALPARSSPRASQIFQPSLMSLAYISTDVGKYRMV